MYPNTRRLNRYLLLGCLRSGLAEYGFSMAKRIKTRSGIAMPGGVVSRGLDDLRRHRLAAAAERAVAEDPRRKPVRITAEGERQYRKWLLEPTALLPATHWDSITARLVFLGDEEPAIVKTVITRACEELWVCMSLLDRSYRMAREEAAESRGKPFNPLPILLKGRLGAAGVRLQTLEEFQGGYDAWLTTRGDTVRATEAGS